MVLTGTWPDAAGRPRTVRMTYTPEADGAVRQVAEASYDSGTSWTLDFDYTYRRIGRATNRSSSMGTNSD